MEKYKYWNSKRNLFWAISRQDPKWELPERRLESLHSGDFQRCFASERGLSLQKMLLWHANVNLRSFEVCPSLLENASHTTDVSIEGHVLAPFLILTYIYRKIRRKTRSWEMLFICKEALLFQASALNHAIVPGPRCQPPQHPIPADTTHRASA